MLLLPRWGVHPLTAHHSYSSPGFGLTLHYTPPREATTWHDKFNSASILMALVNSNTFVSLSLRFFCSRCGVFPFVFVFTGNLRALHLSTSHAPRPPHCSQKLRKVEGF